MVNQVWRCISMLVYDLQKQAADFMEKLRGAVLKYITV